MSGVSYEDRNISHGLAVRLGRAPVKSDTRALMFSKFADLPPELPKASNFWTDRALFIPRSFGNRQYGNCTRAKQAVAMLRMERLETRRTTQIDDQAVIDAYTEMSNRRYGGGDNGAFETDALSDWRNPLYTIKDHWGRPLTIDAYTRVNPFDHEEVKTALWLAKAFGLPFCINLPIAFQRLTAEGKDWDIPAGQAPVGEWQPGSWGGHSMWMFDFDEIGFLHDHTWDLKTGRLTYRAAAIYMDEVHMVIDSINLWKKSRTVNKYLDLSGIKEAVNEVSSLKIAA
jgi:hypothetical protein